MNWMRRIRGAVGMGLTWAVGWFAAGMALLLIVGPDAADVPFPLGFGMFGFFAGVLFSGVLGIVEGRRRFDQMSLPRFAGWGAVGGLVLSGAFVLIVALVEGTPAFLLNVMVLGPVFALAGAGSAAGSLALARSVQERGLLDGGADVAEARLDSESQELLGGGD